MFDLERCKSITDIDGLTELVATTNSIKAQTDLIDGAATQGLLGVEDSLAYRIHELEQHFHVSECWFGKAITPSGTDHVADRVGPSVLAFQLTGGNNTWGPWVQILGATDTPTIVSKVKFDPHRLQITEASVDVSYFVRFTRGDDPAAAWAAGMGTEIVFTALDRKISGGVVDVKTGRAPAGAKIWAQCMSPGVNGNTIDFYPPCRRPFPLGEG